MNVVSRGRGAVFALAALLLPCVGGAQTVQVRGVPFAATQVITRTSAAGSTRTEGRIARSTDGSTYVEEVDAATGVAVRGLIVDVPGQRLVTLDLLRHRYVVRLVPGLVAQEVPVGSAGEMLRWAEAHRTAAEKETTGAVESTQIWLGTRQVSGLLTVGTMRERRALAAARDAEAAALQVDESWFSVDLKMPVLMRERRLATGETIEVMLTKILRAEPGRNLFTIPSGFSPQSAMPNGRRPAVNGVQSDG